MGKRLFKIFIIELTLISIILGVFYLYRNTSIFNYNKLDSIFNSEILTPSDNKKIETFETKSKLEDEIEQGLINANEIIVIRDKTFLKSTDDIFKVINNIVNNNPEIMYYTGVMYSNGRLQVNYSKSKDEIKSNQISLRNERDKIIKEIMKPSMTDYEKIKAVHDYIINNSNYDTNLFEKGEVPLESYTAYGNLVRGVGVCEGYAKSVKYLLDDIGIESIVVVGKSKEQNHAWNLVKIDGEYYHLDATWDDPISENNEHVLQYNYFNLTDDEISNTHSWDRDAYPDANGKYYNFFRYNNLIINTEEELRAKIKDNLLNRRYGILFKYVNFKKDNILINKVIEDIAYSNSKKINLDSYSYSIDENHGIYQLQFNYH